jgi:hypothetical protein
VDGTVKTLIEQLRDGPDITVLYEDLDPIEQAIEKLSDGPAWQEYKWSRKYAQEEEML